MKTNRYLIAIIIMQFLGILAMYIMVQYSAKIINNQFNTISKLRVYNRDKIVQDSLQILYLECKVYECTSLKYEYKRWLKDYQTKQNKN